MKIGLVQSGSIAMATGRPEARSLNIEQPPRVSISKEGRNDGITRRIIYYLVPSRRVRRPMKTLRINFPKEAEFTGSSL